MCLTGYCKIKFLELEIDFCFTFLLSFIEVSLSTAAGVMRPCNGSTVPGVSTLATAATTG